MPAPTFVIARVKWHAGRDALHAVRRAVFIDEQGVPEALEWDTADEACHHVLATSAQGAPIGTGRLLPDGHIGRMAVVREWRGRGVGSAILRALLDIAAHEGFDTVRLHAQTHALRFYARFGFVAVGAEFEEAGIAHRVMVLRRGTAPAA
jgi:predicted GNAT family N-acyltransferase